MSMKTDDKILAPQLRDKLKAVINSELEQLPELLKELDTKERLNVVCKLIPFVFPRVTSIGYTTGEPLSWNN